MSHFVDDLKMIIKSEKFDAQSRILKAKKQSHQSDGHQIKRIAHGDKVAVKFDFYLFEILSDKAASQT